MSDVQWLPAPTRQQGAANVSEFFHKCFSAQPDGVWSAPGRVNLIGEHTDYSGGVSLPTALPHRTYLALKRRKDNKVRLYTTLSSPDSQEREIHEGARPVDGWSFDLGTKSDTESGQKPEGWGAYVVGVAWALIQMGYKPKDGVLGFEAAVDSYVPIGSSLSSSAALEAAAAVALDEVWGLGLAGSDEGRQVLAAACQKAENETVGVPSGGLDQAAALLAAPGQAVAVDFSTDPFTTQKVPFNLEDAGLTLLVIDSRVPRELADGQYATRRAAVDKAAEVLGVPHLRHIKFDQIDDAAAAIASHDDDGVMRRRMRHVITENARAGAFIDLVKHGLGSGGKVDREAAQLAGALMDASHHSLRDDHEVTVRETDLAAATARAAGAYGSRMTGGGFGGAVIALVNSGDVEPVAQAISAGFDAVGLTQPVFLTATPSAGAGKDI